MFGRAARDRTASCAFALARLVRPRADSRVRTNRSSAFGSSLTEQARQPAAEPLNSPFGHNMNRKTINHIDRFFKAPSDPPYVPGTNSVLHLLRRDVVQCLGRDPQTGLKLSNIALFPGIMGIIAGVDLLAKFHAGQDGSGAGSRFEEFVRTYFRPVRSGWDRIIWQFRNSLLHSFGLHSKDNKGRMYHFRLNLDDCPLLRKRGGDKYYVGITPLHERFESAVSLYEFSVRADSMLQANFERMYPTYGTIRIRSSFMTALEKIRSGGFAEP